MKTIEVQVEILLIHTDIAKNHLTFQPPALAAYHLTRVLEVENP